MSATMNGQAMWDGRSDSTASRCADLLERGLRKFGISTPSALVVKPTKGRDVTWMRNGSTLGRDGRRLENYPDVTGLSVDQIAEKFGLRKQVAGRLLCIQSRRRTAGGGR
jgi:hypothetical protein